MNGEPFEVDILALPERADTRPRMSRSTSMSGIAARNRIAVRMSTYEGSWPNQAVSGRPERVLRVRASTQLRGEKRSGFVRASAACSRSKPPWRAMQSIWAPSQLVPAPPTVGRPPLRYAILVRGIRCSTGGTPPSARTTRYFAPLVRCCRTSR